jgi:hypothetical protein
VALVFTAVTSKLRPVLSACLVKLDITVVVIVVAALNPANIGYTNVTDLDTEAELSAVAMTILYDFEFVIVSVNDKSLITAPFTVLEVIV